MVENPPRRVWPYLLGGLAIGSALGVLFAPKPGKEIRKDVTRWLKEGREISRKLTWQFREKLPERKTRLLAAIRAGREAFQAPANHHKKHLLHA